MSNSEENLSAEWKENALSLNALRSFTKEPTHFWQEYMKNLLQLFKAKYIMVCTKNQSSNALRVVSHNFINKSNPLQQVIFDKIESSLPVLTEQFVQSISCQEGLLEVVSVNTGAKGELCFIGLYFEKNTQNIKDLEKQLLLINDVPFHYQQSMISQKARQHIADFSSVLDLAALINNETRFIAASMRLCNELAARHKCERVSLGWIEKGYIVLKTISHMDNFDKKMEAVSMLEACMEEAADQDTEVIIPKDSEEYYIEQDHLKFSKSQGVDYICSLPLRINNEVTAVITFERSKNAFTKNDLMLMRLSGDHIAVRLNELRDKDRWFGLRLKDYFKEKLADIVGYEHTWYKIIAVFIAIILAVICFGRTTYRVEAPMIIRTDDIAYLTAPFNGHIENVLLRSGDPVQENQLILAMDKSELLLEEAAISAEINRYQRELEKSRAANNLAEMKISEALLKQTNARFDMIRYRLSKSDIKAPFSGIIVEGDLKEKIGAPLRQGDVLFKIAKIEDLFIELKIKERDIHFIKDASTGEFALASQPDEKFEMKISKINPVAIPEQEGNIFKVRSKITAENESWWRPGMTGVAKVNAGKRTYLWILTHRTVNFLRLHLWW